MKYDYDCIVLGLGGLGSAALYWLARQNKNVLGLEQFEIGHIRGGSQDHSRIIRLSYHTPQYVDLAKQAYTTWAEVEADANEKIILKTGGLDIFPPNAAIPIADYTGSMTTAGVPFEILSPVETMRRWSQFHLPEGTTTLYQAESGLASPNIGNCRPYKMAKAYGATIRDNAPITNIRPIKNEIEVEAGGEVYRCQTLILAPGAWTNHALAHFGLHLPLEITQEQVTYYASPDITQFSPERFPIWIWMDEPCFYGFPVFGEAGPKIAQDVGGKTVTAESRSFEPDLENARPHRNLPEKPYPRHARPPNLYQTCLYTLTPDRDFVLNSLPGHPNVSSRWVLPMPTNLLV
ncbi:MAG: FAD-dependent oxidoreductase [Anaerolineae bacterium]|nr:FAD-dependent oxidoreductase [Anaerolineae bacterium]